MNEVQRQAEWNRCLSESMLAMRQLRFEAATIGLRQIVGNDSRKARQWTYYRNALAAYAFALYKSGAVTEALAYQTKLLSLYPNDAEARGNFLLILKAEMAEAPDSAEFQRVLHSVLEQSDIGEYAVTVAQTLLKNQEFARAFETILSAGEQQALKALSQGRLRTLMQTPLLLLLLRRTLIPLPEFELFFRRVRKLLIINYGLQSKTAIRPGRIELEFIGALAHYIWLTDYALPEDDEETALADRLQLELASGRHAPLDPVWQTTLACFALYRSGLELPDSEHLFAHTNWKSFLQPLVQEWHASLEERVLAAEIDSLTPISGDISAQVRRQYEENPFPRWRHDPVADRRTSARQWLAGFAPDLGPPADFDQPISVLTAGCGTGLEPISLLRQIEIRRYLAVDLSLSSLAYARRMARDFGLAAAIDFKQADITQLGGLAERFDLITASGVLHHLQDPLEGWRVLTRLLKPGGVMLVSLYSETARQTVTLARRLIAEQAWKPEPNIMRQFRAALLAGEYPPLQALLQWRDFYNLSMFRDLVFHVNEHLFTLPLIQRYLTELDLRFIGMRGLPTRLQVQYQAAFPQDPHGNNIINWTRFEAQHPQAFVSMYGLVLQKPGVHNQFF